MSVLDITPQFSPVCVEQSDNQTSTLLFIVFLHKVEFSNDHVSWLCAAYDKCANLALAQYRTYLQEVTTSSRGWAL